MDGWGGYLWVGGGMYIAPHSAKNDDDPDDSNIKEDHLRQTP